MNDSMMDVSAFDNAIDEQFKKDLKLAKKQNKDLDRKV